MLRPLRADYADLIMRERRPLPSSNGCTSDTSNASLIARIHPSGTDNASREPSARVAGTSEGSTKRVVPASFTASFGLPALAFDRIFSNSACQVPGSGEIRADCRRTVPERPRHDQPDHSQNVMRVHGPVRGDDVFHHDVPGLLAIGFRPLREAEKVGLDECKVLPARATTLTSFRGDSSPLRCVASASKRARRS